ncbi:MAG: tRNA (guanosine(46)-N7)-methyltransferase TrmB, partial [Verrucomicrobiota bacterium]|nr:tRNA (guanosine(46)-N7)-methyltransferase TrmB [Verrucomicrobiota bacterium]
GKVTCVTDDAQYAGQILKVFQTPEWRLLFQTTDLPDYGKSFFKDLWLQAGRTIYYASFEKV